MKKDILTKYLTVFLLICVVLDGILLCAFSTKPWWNNWMVMAPNLYMILGAFFCQLMKKNIDAQVSKQAWLLIYKGIKMLLTIVMLVLFIIFVKQGSKAFVLITAVAYLVGLVAETCIVMHYIKHSSK